MEKIVESDGMVGSVAALNITTSENLDRKLSKADAQDLLERLEQDRWIVQVRLLYLVFTVKMSLIKSFILKIIHFKLLDIFFSNLWRSICDRFNSSKLVFIKVFCTCVCVCACERG